MLGKSRRIGYGFLALIFFLKAMKGGKISIKAFEWQLFTESPPIPAQLFTAAFVQDLKE